MHNSLESLNPLCMGCSILDRRIPEHTVLDYENKEQVDILFVSDSMRYGYDGILSVFSDKELTLIIDNLPKGLTWGVSVAIKCPTIKENDLATKDQHICRQFLKSTILTYRPKLVFACGNLALKMLTKKSGIMDKRGRAIKETYDNFTFSVVPIYHPYAVVREPKLKYLFDLDIKNGIDKIIFEKTEKGTFNYFLVDSLDKLKTVEDELRSSPIKAVDIETEGLDFRKDKIHTVAVAYDPEKPVVVFPIDHRDSPLSPNDRDYCLKFLKSILEDNSIKVLQKCQFDYKFLKGYGIEITNMWDTKVMAHLIDENTPKSLKDLVKEFYPLELDIL